MPLDKSQTENQNQNQSNEVVDLFCSALIFRANYIQSKAEIVQLSGQIVLKAERFFHN